MMLNIYDDLPQLLKRDRRGSKTIVHHLARRASVKDVIESFGIPHTEIGRLQSSGRDVSFSHIVDNSEQIDIFPIPTPINVQEPTLLRPKPLRGIAFAADDNVGKLASLLRMAGIDTYHSQSISDVDLESIAQLDGRIILSRDKDLLKRKSIIYGRLVRAIFPEQQLAEIIRLYDLKGQIQPFTRCMKCNDILEPIQKIKIMDRLKPLTIKHYNSFKTCGKCGNIYWQGSHHARMAKILNNCLQEQ